MTNDELRMTNAWARNPRSFVIRHSSLVTYRSSAFTLLEVLLALGMIALLTGSLFASLQIGFRAREHAEASLEPVRTAEIALDVIAADLQCAPPPHGIMAGAFTGTDGKGGILASDADSLSFFTRAVNSLDAAPGIVAVQYALVQNEDGTAALVRSVTTNLLAPETVAPAGEVVCGRVASLNMRYFDGTSWYDSWDSTVHDNALPAAVTVQLEIAAKGSGEARTFGMTRLIAMPCAVVPQTTTETAGAGNG